MLDDAQVLQPISFVSGHLQQISPHHLHACRCAAGLLGDSQLREGFVSGFLLILFSELGDKTFFIAVLLALKYREAQVLVFAGSFGALAVMTVISVRAFPQEKLEKHIFKAS